MQHIIQKQVMAFSASTKKLMQEWEFRVQDMLTDVVNPAVEKCFDEEFPGEENIAIDHLEIDLGVVNNASRYQIDDRIIKQLLQQLRELNPGPGRKRSEDLILQKFKKQNSFKKLGPHETLVACFVYFLIHGRLPWWVDAGKPELKTGWINELSMDEAIWITGEISSYPHAVQRLIYQFDETFIYTLLSYRNHSLPAAVLKVWKELEKIFSKANKEAGQFRTQYWTYWIEKCLGNAADEKALHFALKEMVHHQPGLKVEIIKLAEDRPEPGNKQEGIVLMLLKEALKKDDPDNTSKTNLAGDELSITPGEKINAGKINERTDGDPSSGPAKSGKSPKSELFNNSSDKIRENDEIRSLRSVPEKEEDLDELYCGAAGLILLHPFLAELFRQRQLWTDTGWSSPTAQHHAVLLVTWLAYNDTNIDEYFLEMPKLLCGMPFAQPLDTTVILDKDDLDSATELLEAVIKHWTALGNTSIDGLREAFIMREGKLTKKEGGWLLNIEEKAIDILLNRLPWGISMIRLPWMKNELIYVEWV